MTRNAFIFCIGYQGGTAIVDKKLEARYRRKSCRELFAEGLYKPALAAAVYDKNQDDLEWIRTRYSTLSGREYRDVDAIIRALGVADVRDSIQRTLYL